MELGEDRLRAILSDTHSFYGSKPAQYRTDEWVSPNARDLIVAQFRSDSRVLDIGCGNGVTLLENWGAFRTGVGIDNDPEHIQMAEDRLKSEKVQNVEFRQLDFLKEGEQLEAESFDFVYSERSPIGYDSYSVQAALRVLKPGGSIFCELIGELHHQEVKELFDTGPRRTQMITVSDQMRVAMERNGVEILLSADIIGNRYYPDIYEWLQFQCSIWAWGGGSLPSPDDIRLGQFAERNTIPSGEIKTTHHVAWVGGVKIAGESPYPTFRHFK